MVTNAVRLAPLLNRYLIQAGPPKTIMIPQALQLAKIQEITVRGILLKNQLMTWDSRMLKRRVSIGKRGGRYALHDDGSLQFYNRGITDEPFKLFEAVQQASLQTKVQVAIPRQSARPKLSKKKARAKRPGRLAELEVRYLSFAKIL